MAWFYESTVFSLPDSNQSESEVRSESAYESDVDSYPETESDVKQILAVKFYLSFKRKKKRK